MMYPFLTLEDGTEIVHSEMKPDGFVKVHIERPDEKLGFCQATCYLPGYRLEGIEGFTEKEINDFLQVIQETAHLIIEFSKCGGFDNASGF